MPCVDCAARVVVEQVDFGIPLSRVFAGVRGRNGSFYLDSAQAGPGQGGFSFVGFDPFLVFRSKGSRISLVGDGRVSELEGDPLDELKRLLLRFPSSPVPGLPFSGGAVGYFAYEFAGRIEPGMGGSRSNDFSSGSAHDAEFGFYDGCIAFDHAEGRTLLVANPVHRDGAETILRRLDKAVRDGICGEAPRPAPAKPSGAETADSGRTAPRPQMPKAAYLAAVARIKEYIAAGDVYQVNLTQRFDAPLFCDPYILYQTLRRRSPAPFSCYLNLGDTQIVGSSPERLLRIAEGRAETRPIKGTRPRGGSAAEDARLRDELLASEKDRAELLMIVDLERNDLGRVCEFGSVRVDEPCRLESHPTVHHLVATVSGRLRPGCDACDCVRALFPGGSITGAPKIRAVQIIGEVETSPRRVYTGSVGYLGFDGAADLNIAIRTIVCSGGRASYHVGGGIVWDSDPEEEYRECLDKGRAMFESIVESHPC